MLVAKFVPGLTTVMPPLAGIFAVGRVRFALYDLGGVVLWAGTWMALGYVFSDAIVLVTERAAALGRTLGVLVAVALAGYVLLKYVRRRLFLRSLRIARISPASLKGRLDAGEDVTVIDLRDTARRGGHAVRDPGESLDDRRCASTSTRPTLLRARELVLYCS